MMMWVLNTFLIYISIHHINNFFHYKCVENIPVEVRWKMYWFIGHYLLFNRSYLFFKSITFFIFLFNPILSQNNGKYTRITRIAKKKLLHVLKNFYNSAFDVLVLLEIAIDFSVIFIKYTKNLEKMLNIVRSLSKGPKSTFFKNRFIWRNKSKRTNTHCETTTPMNLR